MSNWNNTGLSVLELSHRSAEFVSISEKCKNDLREFLQIPPNFKIFLCQGGATLQYGALIKNFLKFDANGKSKGANYIVTGLWSNLCINEAKNMMTDTPPTLTATGVESNFK